MFVKYKILYNPKNLQFQLEKYQEQIRKNSGIKVNSCGLSKLGVIKVKK